MATQTIITCDMCGKTAQGIRPRGWRGDYIHGMARDFCSDSCYEEWQERTGHVSIPEPRIRRAERITPSEALVFVEYMHKRMRSCLSRVLGDAWEPTTCIDFAIRPHWPNLIRLAGYLDGCVQAIRAEAAKQGDAT